MLSNDLSNDTKNFETRYERYESNRQRALVQQTAQNVNTMVILINKLYSFRTKAYTTNGRCRTERTILLKELKFWIQIRKVILLNDQNNYVERSN